MAAFPYIVMTPYFYFMILKIMCRYTKYLSESYNSIGQMFFHLQLLCQNFPLVSVQNLCKNGITFETTPIFPNHDGMMILLH